MNPASNITVKQPEKTSIAVYFVMLLLFLILATPHYRFEILQAIRIERLLVIAAIVVLVFSGKVFSRSSALSPIVILLYISLMIGHYMSPYRDIGTSIHWVDNYWKLLIFYFVVLFSINSRDDLVKVFIAIAVISLLYQILSWMDFLRGGNYVYQQGMKRMTGLWSRHTLGTANAWGSFGLFSIPFAVFWYRTTEDKRVRIAMLFLVAISFGSILASGTRAAFVVAVFLAMFALRKKLMANKFLIVTAVVLAVAGLYYSLPDDYRHRYFDLINIGEDGGDEADDVAAKSAESRIEGLTDGWSLFLKRPLFGYGPDTTATARLEVNDKLAEADQILKLHNLYGQVLSESGLIGTVLFVLLVWTAFRMLTKLANSEGIPPPDKMVVDNFVYTLRYLLVIMLLYGLFSHNLYNPYWMFIYASIGALSYVTVVKKGAK